MGGRKAIAGGELFVFSAITIETCAKYEHNKNDSCDSRTRIDTGRFVFLRCKSSIVGNSCPSFLYFLERIIFSQRKKALKKLNQSQQLLYFPQGEIRHRECFGPIKGSKRVHPREPDS